MRKASVVGATLLLSTGLFSSCTCHNQQLSEPPPALQEKPSGFHAAAAKTPVQRAQAATATPVVGVTPQEKPSPQMAGAPSSTPPANIPADFPKDVPIFKDAAVSQVQDLANKAHNVIFTTAAPVSDVSAFYQQKLTTSGWKVTQQFERSNHAFMTFQKGNMIANVTVAEDVRNPGQQVIAIMYEEQQPAEFDDF